jgi:acetyl-CoA carboxylase biotin carboxyl carrier protein
MTERDGGGSAAAPPGAALLALIDRLEGLLERSALTEIEVEAGDTALVLRTPAALAPTVVGIASAGGVPAEGAAAAAPATGDGGTEVESGLHAVLAPLTGLYYISPSPGAQPYIRQGGEVQTGQVIGLIEAMKLFNEIKSDVTGKIVRICVENGALVKAKQPLIEVQPS